MKNDVNTKVYYILIFITLFSCSRELPYNLEIADMPDLTYRIQDKSGISVIEPNYYIGFIDQNPKVKYLSSFSYNELGFVIFLKSTNNINYYVLINPKPLEEQIYSETVFDYHVYSVEDYEKLNLKDNWQKIPFNSNSDTILSD